MLNMIFVNKLISSILFSFFYLTSIYLCLDLITFSSFSKVFAISKINDFTSSSVFSPDHIKHNMQIEYLVNYQNKISTYLDADLNEKKHLIDDTYYVYKAINNQNLQSFYVYFLTSKKSNSQKLSNNKINVANNYPMVYIKFAKDSKLFEYFKQNTNVRLMAELENKKLKNQKDSWHGINQAVAYIKMNNNSIAMPIWIKSKDSKGLDANKLSVIDMHFSLSDYYSL